MAETSITDAGLAGPRGLKRVLVPFRKAVLRLLRPSFQQVEAGFAAVDNRLDELRRLNAQTDRRAGRTEAFGWDYVALVCRVSALEDLVEELRGEVAARRPEGKGKGESPHTFMISLPNVEPATARRRAEP